MKLVVMFMLVTAKILQSMILTPERSSIHVFGEKDG